jgi:DNA polymerase-4
MTRSIIHVNIADFAVAVERVVDTRLKDRPVIIAPGGTARAAVYDMSEEAYQEGVRKHMALRRALRICRNARILPPHPDRYERAMRMLLKRTLPYSPLIETGEGDGHLFVDVTGTSRLFGAPADVARRLSRQVEADLGMAPTWSVASNKLVAKVATRLVKPVGEYVVGAGDEKSFLSPLPVWLMPGIERDDLSRFREFNLRTVSQVAAWHLEHLEILFGNRARFLYETVRGIDLSPVLPAGEKPLVIKIDHEFSEDTNVLSVFKGALYRMIEAAGRELRRQRLAARRVGIVLDYSDGIRRARQSAAKPATANDLKLFNLAEKTLMLAWTRRVRIRHMRLICDRLVFPPAQLALFPEQQEKKEKQNHLVTALDRIRERFGHDAVQVGRTLAA